MILVGCKKDEGEAIEKPQPNPEDVILLIKKFRTPPELSFKHGNDTCYGFWKFQVYKKCDHRLHGLHEDGDVKNLRLHLLGLRADSKEEALSRCETYVADYDLPLGVEFNGAEVFHRGKTIYDCFTTRSVAVTNERRSFYCGIEDNLDPSEKEKLPADLQDLADLDFIEMSKSDEFIIKQSKFNVQKLRQREGFTNFQCSTCDDLPIYTHKDLVNKFLCLMKEFLRLEESNAIANENKIKRDVENFNNTTNITFDPKNLDEDEEDFFDFDDEDDEEVEIEEEIIENPRVEEESEEAKKEREINELHKVEVMKGLSCLKTYYSSLFEEEQITGITKIEEKYNIRCDVGRK